VRTALDVQRLSEQSRLLQRAFVLSDTAPAEAIYFSLKLFDAVPNCTRRVIDISGDGTPNAGSDVRAARNFAERSGVTINAIAIESLGLAITNFYRNAVITRNGFVMTARTHREYPATIRAKILREISRIFG
jgi:Ca-activated chloride channel family protein